MDPQLLGGFLAPLPMLMLVVWLILTDRLVAGARHKRLQERADRLEQMVWDSLGVTGRAVHHAEVTHDVLASLPDPNLPAEEAP